jgi:hypothetical protein
MHDKDPREATGFKRAQRTMGLKFRDGTVPSVDSPKVESARPRGH